MSLGAGEKQEGLRKGEQKGQTIPHARGRMSEYSIASKYPDEWPLRRGKRNAIFADTLDGKQKRENICFYSRKPSIIIHNKKRNRRVLKMLDNVIVR